MYNIFSRLFCSNSESNLTEYYKTQLDMCNAKIALLNEINSNLSFCNARLNSELDHLRYIDKSTVTLNNLLLSVINCIAHCRKYSLSIHSPQIDQMLKYIDQSVNLLNSFACPTSLPKY